jgi:transposase
MHDGTFGTFKASRRERVDIRVGVERRRRWSREEKLRIVRESLEPNAVVTDVAQRNEVSASLIYVWRRQALAGLLDGFHRVEIVSDAAMSMIEAHPGTTDAVVPDTRECSMPAVRHAPTEVPGPRAPRPIIEVTLPGGAVVRVDGAVDANALRTVLGVLVDR